VFLKVLIEVMYKYQFTAFTVLKILKIYIMIVSFWVVKDIRPLQGKIKQFSAKKPSI